MDTILLLIIAGSGLIIGILIGLMINALRGNSSKRMSISPETEERAIDNIMLWHDRSGGKLIVDIDGATFTEPNQMQDDQRARLATSYSQLRRFLGIQEHRTRSAADNITQQPSTHKYLSETPPPTAYEPVQPIPIKLGLPNKVMTEPIKPLSIVVEINEILQNIIESTPLATRGLKLLETPIHTISVYLDKKQYQSIDEVPDPMIQEIIHSAVKQWEDHVS